MARLQALLARRLHNPHRQPLHLHARAPRSGPAHIAQSAGYDAPDDHVLDLDGGAVADVGRCGGRGGICLLSRRGGQCGGCGMGHGDAGWVRVRGGEGGQEEGGGKAEGGEELWEEDVKGED